MTKREKQLITSAAPSDKLIKATITAHETYGPVAMAFKRAIKDA